MQRVIKNTPLDVWFLVCEFLDHDSLFLHASLVNHELAQVVREARPSQLRVKLTHKIQRRSWDSVLDFKAVHLGHATLHWLSNWPRLRQLEICRPHIVNWSDIELPPVQHLVIEAHKILHLRIPDTVQRLTIRKWNNWTLTCLEIPAVQELILQEVELKYILDWLENLPTKARVILQNCPGSADDLDSLASINLIQ
jgi:hypothetical protein